MMVPPELRRMLPGITGKRATGRVLIADALVGSWTQGELIAFGFGRMCDGRWLAPVDWRTR